MEGCEENAPLFCESMHHDVHEVAQKNTPFLHETQNEHA